MREQKANKALLPERAFLQFTPFTKSRYPMQRSSTNRTDMFQRLRDPIHDLVEFADTPFERMIWSLLESPEFQRLRRVRQLGFSDFVFPGATHSRFSHSVGVFHTSRILCNVLREKLGSDFISDRAEVAICAALIHDLGHGPFSHAFEAALGEEGRHEEWTERFIKETHLRDKLESFRRGFSDEVAAIFKSETSPDIYSSIVSSQFDADRLDYMRRDRMMSGTQLGGIDFTWLVRNLEVRNIEIGSDDQQFAEVSTFVLGPKALWAGEAYVLSLFHLYPAVYLHKTTRGAEKIFSNLMQSVRSLVQEGRIDETGLPGNHPIIRYLREQTLANYAELDDAVVWGALPLLAQSRDPSVGESADRLRYRRLYKAIDVRSALGDGRLNAGEDIDQRVLRFKRLLAAKMQEDQSLVHRILIDRFERNPYKQRGYETPKGIERIHILENDHPIDLARVSDVVAALKPFHVFRLYVESDDDRAKALIAEVMKEAHG